MPKYDEAQSTNSYSDKFYTVKFFLKAKTDSAAVVALKAQQEPHLPQSLIGGSTGGTAVLQSTMIISIVSTDEFAFEEELVSFPCYPLDSFPYIVGSSNIGNSFKFQSFFF